MENFGIPISVGGVVVFPGHLIHADRHGAIVIPRDIAREVAAAAHELDAAERILINEAQSGTATRASLTAANAECQAALMVVQQKYARRV